MDSILRGGGVAKALIRQIRSGAAAPWRWAARASRRQVNAPSVWALTRSSKEASLMSTVAMDRRRWLGCRRAGPRRARRWSCGRACRRSRRRAVLGWSGSAGRWRPGGVRTNRGELVGRGVHVEEGVDRGEGGLCGGSVAPAVGLCVAPDRSPSCGCRRFQGGGGPRAPMCCPPVVRGSLWASRQQGWAGGPRVPPARGGGACPRGACSGRMNGQCTAVTVGQYSTLTWHISASSSRSW